MRDALRVLKADAGCDTLSASFAVLIRRAVYFNDARRYIVLVTTLFSVK